MCLCGCDCVRVGGWVTGCNCNCASVCEWLRVCVCGGGEGILNKHIHVRVMCGVIGKSDRQEGLYGLVATLVSKCPHLQLRRDCPLACICKAGQP